MEIITKTQNAIEYLLATVFPDLEVARAGQPPYDDPKQAQALLGQYDIYSMYIRSLPGADVIREAARIKNIKALKSEEGVKKLKHNQSSSKVSIELWGRMPSWDSLEEGSLLCQNIDPEKLKWKDGIESYIKYCSRARKVNENRLLISRAIEAGDLCAREKPAIFIAWAKQKNIDYPSGLEEEVKKHGDDIMDFKSAYKEKCAEVARLEGELESSKEELEQIKKQEKPISTKERESMLKLIIGTAISGYGYNPQESRSPIPQQIANDLAELGISLDVDTVRKYLREAKDLLPSQDTEKD